MRGPISILSSEKDFVNPWIGNATANRLGLHVGRIVVADALDRVRWAMRAPKPADRRWIADLRRDGVVAIPDFLPAEDFGPVQKEVVGTIRETLKRFPPRDNKRPGFGDKEAFGGIGFDRFDGSTLNRFVQLAADRTPRSLEMVHSDRFKKLYSAAQGRPFPLSAVSLYYTRHGSSGVHDIQRDLHSDTFHFTIKLWYFVEDVPPEAGPFSYVLGSNHSTRRRLAWEYRRSLAASSGRGSRGGSFRVSEAELQELGYPQPTMFAVKANTLVIADTNGFHRRGDAPAGAERFSIYGGMRRSPFLP